MTNPITAILNPLCRRAVTPNRITIRGKKASKNLQEVDGLHHAISNETTPRMTRNASEKTKRLFSFNDTPSAEHSLRFEVTLLGQIIYVLVSF
jgi:hypothetical protein